MLRANPTSKFLYVLDARPKANAVANQAIGAGYERVEIYRATKFKFLGIDNIHVMRESYRKVCMACSPYDTASEPNNWHVAVNTWLGHQQAILRGAVRVVDIVHEHESTVVIHCRFKPPPLTTSSPYILNMALP